LESALLPFIISGWVFIIAEHLVLFIIASCDIFMQALIVRRSAADICVLDVDAPAFAEPAPVLLEFDWAAALPANAKRAIPAQVNDLIITLLHSALGVKTRDPAGTFRPAARLLAAWTPRSPTAQLFHPHRLSGYRRRGANKGDGHARGEEHRQ
jgi:hypothetical protein